MNIKRSATLQITERVISMLMAAGLGYLALSHVDGGHLIAWGVVGAAALAKLILRGIAGKAKAVA